MLRFAVTKDGAFVGRPFDSHEEAMEVAELEKLGDPSADVRVLPVLTAGEGLDPDEGQALVDAILEGEDFSDLPPEHRGPTGSPDEEQGEAAPDADPARGGSGPAKRPTAHGKKGVPASAKGLSFFVRHPHCVPVADGVLEELWAQDRFAVPLPGEGAAGGAPEGANPGVPQKPWGHGMAAGHVEDLAKRGGYAWVETRVRPGVAKIGRIVPQRPEDVRAAWTAPKHPKKHKGDPGREVVLRTLRLEDVRGVAPDEAASLRAERPLTDTIRPWTVVGPRLEATVEGVPLRRTWAHLTPLQQRAACAEFLRSNRNPEYPKLEFLLSPGGARLDNVDVFGMEEDGTEILARVTSLQKDSPQVGSEAWRLGKKHQRPGRKLVLFCSFFGSADPAGSTPSLFPPEPFGVPLVDGVSFLPVEEVLEWVKAQTVYADALFSL